MSNRRRIMAAALARGEALSVAPSDYTAWLGSAISTRE